VSTMSPADAWQRSGMPADRPSVSGRSSRHDRRGDDYGPRSPRSTPPRARGGSPERARPAERMRAPQRDHYGEPDDLPRGRRPEAGRGSSRADRAPVDRRTGRPLEPREATRPPRGQARPTETQGSRLRGAVAVAAVFLLTLAVAGAESFIGVGLGTITLVALVLTTVLAALLVRRRDLVSVIVSPPLVFIGVAVVDVVAAPSASLSLATIATLLIRGFPAMAIATGAALVIGLIRMAARR
jgi:hypothetical protein